MAFPRLHVPLWLARAMLGAMLASLAGLAFWTHASYQRIALRETMLERARVEAPWAAAYLERAYPSWVPMPWQEHGDLLSAIAAAGKRGAAVLAAIDMTSIDKIDAFADAANAWSDQVEFCSAAPRSDPRFAAACGRIRGRLLPESWRARFQQVFAPRYYLTLDAERRVGAGTRHDIATTICNVAPYAIRAAGLIEIASPAVTGAQAQLLGIKLDPVKSVEQGQIAPGSCHKHTERLYDGTGGAKVASAALDPALVSWLHDRLRENNPKRFAAVPRASAGGEALGCAAKGRSVAEAAVIKAMCGLGHEAISLHPTRIVEQGIASARVRGNLQLVSDPYYYTIPAKIRDDGRVEPAYAQLSKALEHVRGFGRVVETQFELDRRWNGKASPFTLGGTLDDENSPLGEGVSIKGLPRQSVWRELVGLPENGVIVQINDRPVFSKFDILEELWKHGRSRAAGAHVPLRLTFRINDGGSVQYKQGLVRLLFDTAVAQEFDTDIWIRWTGFVSGMIARLYEIRCFVTEGGKLLLSMIGVDVQVRTISECVWILNQQVAYVMQINRELFEFWEQIGREAIITFISQGVSMLVFEARAALATVSGAFSYLAAAVWLKSAILQGALDGLWTIGLQPPSTPIVNRLYEAGPAAGWAFVESVGQSAVEGAGKRILRMN